MIDAMSCRYCIMLYTLEIFIYLFYLFFDQYIYLKTDTKKLHIISL